MEIWLTLAALALMFLALVREWFSPDLTLFVTVLGFWLTGVIDASEATAGFSSPQVLTVGLLFVVAAAMKETGALESITRLLLITTRKRWLAMHRLLWPTAALSAFMNNTPIVAMLTPEVRDWAGRNGWPTSRLLIPLSYAAILGGTCTLIGTSTNLLVSGLMEQAGMAPLEMFELTVVGLPATIVGILYLTTVGHRLLPDRSSPDDQLSSGEPQYEVRLEVTRGCQMVGQSVEEAGLRSLEGLFLVEIDRGTTRLAPARPTDKLQVGDQLVFFGIAETVVSLLERPGLVPVSDDGSPAAAQAPSVLIHEIVVLAGSPLVGQNLRDARFRRRYDAAVVAIHRGGQRLHAKLGDIVLRPGDTLLVQASRGFRDTWSSSRDFLLMESRQATADRQRGPLALLILGAMVILMASGVVSTLMASALAAVALVLSGCVPIGRARASINLSVLVLMASSFGLSAAVENSGLATWLSGLATSSFGSHAPWVALAAVYILCAVVTEMLSNTAAAAMVFPIAITLAHQMGVDPRSFAVAVAVASSMSFVTPLGYQTNLLVYGPGGYRFGDFTRAGLPLAVLCFVVAMIIIPWAFG